MNTPKVIDIDGLTLIYHFTDVNNEFCLMPYFKTGAITENDDNCGITHFLEHMLGKQTKNMSEKEALDMLKLYLPKYNAATAYQYMFMIANTSVRHMEKVFKFVADIIQNSVFTDERTKKESKVVEQEICKYEIDNISIASDNLLRIFYKYPAIKNEVLGTKKKVRSYTGNDIKTRFDTLATKENMVLSFAGNASEEDVVNLVKKYFKSVPSNKKTAIISPIITINGKEDIFIKYKKEDNTITGIVATNMNYNNQEEKERVMASLLFNYLNAQGQPLWNELREQKTLVYQFFAEPFTLTNSSIMQFFFQTTKENILECITSYAKVINTLYTTGLSDQEFEELKESVRILLDGQIALCTSVSERNARHYTLGFNFYDRDARLNIINNLTINEFNAFLQRVLRTNFVGASFVGNITKAELPTLEDLRKLFYK